MIVKGSLPPARGGRSEKHVIEERRRRTTEKRAKVVKECCSGFELVKGGGGVGGALWDDRVSGRSGGKGNPNVGMGWLPRC